MKTCYRYFLFDLYGTLVDISTNENKYYLWQKLTRELNRMGIALTLPEVRARYRQYAEAAVQEAEAARGTWAEPDLAIVFRRLLGDAATEDTIAQLAHTFRMTSLSHLRLYPGARETLHTLRARGCGVYLLSNAQALFTRPELDMLRLTDAFDGIALSSDYGYRKPSADFYRAVLSRYSLAAEDCLMVGNDDEADCRGAAEAGLDSVYLYTAQSPEPSGPLPPNTVRLRSVRSVLKFAQAARA